MDDNVVSSASLPRRMKEPSRSCFSSSNLTYQVANAIGFDIVTGIYDGRRSLPSQAALCGRYKVSRIVMREAMNMLISKGMIYTRMSQGMIIEPNKNWNLFDRDILNWVVQRTPSLNLLREFNQVRYAIEPAAASIAALRRKNEQLYELSLILNSLSSSQLNLQQQIDNLVNFHINILSSCNNRFYQQLSYFVKTAIEYQYTVIPADKYRTNINIEPYHDVYTALTSRNSSEANRSMKSVLSRHNTV